MIHLIFILKKVAVELLEITILQNSNKNMRISGVICAYHDIKTHRAYMIKTK